MRIANVVRCQAAAGAASATAVGALPMAAVSQGYGDTVEDRIIAAAKYGVCRSLYKSV